MKRLARSAHLVVEHPPCQSGLLPCAFIMVAIGACGTVSVPTHAVRVGPGLAAGLAAADETRAPWRCSGSRELAPDSGFGKWEVRGGTLRRSARDSKPLTGDSLSNSAGASEMPPGSPQRDTQVGEAEVIGIVADTAGNDPKTIAALASLRAKLEQANADLVVSLGGMGSTQAEISATLGALVGRWLLVALPGDLESTSAHVAAVAGLRARGAAVIDGRGVGSIEMQAARLAVIPGVGSAYRSLAGSDSCVWTASDVEATHRGLSAFPGLRIAVSAEAPREVINGEVTGEVALVPKEPVDIVVHGPTQVAPTPGTRGDRDGAQIGLSPGSADATTRLPPFHNPTAGLLFIRGRTWEWRTVDLRLHVRESGVPLVNPRQ